MLLQRYQLSVSVHRQPQPFVAANIMYNYLTFLNNKHILLDNLISLFLNVLCLSSVCLRTSSILRSCGFLII